jgi:hypothetical protein
VIANFHPHELWLSTDAPNPELDPILAQAKQAWMQVSVRAEGDKFDFGGASFRVLGPRHDESRAALRPNLQSLVFTVTLGETTALLEADAQRAEERRIMDEHPEAQLLKVAHHGSGGSTSAALLAAVHPQYAVISAGVRNVYGHPRIEVLERLQHGIPPHIRLAGPHGRCCCRRDPGRLTARPRQDLSSVLVVIATKTDGESAVSGVRATSYPQGVPCADTFPQDPDGSCSLRFGV